MMTILPTRTGVALVLALVATGDCGAALGAERAAQKQPSAADLVREVYSAEAWIRQVDSCRMRVKSVQSEPTRREATHALSEEEFERLRGSRDWQETQHGEQEIAWDKSRVRCLQDYGELQTRMVNAWDGRVFTMHEKSPRKDRESYGIYDDSRKDILVSLRVNLWSYGGLVGEGRNAWWGTNDLEQHRLWNFVSPEDFRLAGESLVDGRECHVVESRAGGMQLHIDKAERRVRRITHLSVPNDLDDAVWLAAMKKVTDVELASSRDWRAWVETLDPERRLAVQRRLSEEVFPSKRIRSETYPADYTEVAPGGWMPRRFTAISNYPDWDLVEKTGKYTYEVSRVEVEVAELKVNEPLSDDALAIAIPEGGKVYDWRFDPPVEYEFRKDRTAEEIRALAEEAKRKQDEKLAPYRDMVAQIEKRVGQEAPELPQASWFNGGPLKLSALRGKVVILHFWATWCGPCHNDIRTLVSQNKSPSSDPLVIGIHDAKAEVDAVKKAIAEKGIRYPVCIDSKDDSKDGSKDGVSQRGWYRIRGIPYTILIDKAGRVAGHGDLQELLERASRIK